MMMVTTATAIVSWVVEGEELAVPPAFIVDKPAQEITLSDIRRFYHGPEGIFMFKSADDDTHLSLLGDAEHRYHWTIVTNDNVPVPVWNGSTIFIKVRPNERGQFSQESFVNIQSVHQRPKPLDPSQVYACTYPGCNKTFNKPWRLKSHLRNHTGEQKPHICTHPGCGKSFNESQALKNHQRVHSGEKPFQCNICNKKFSERGNLRKHQRLHSGVKPYECSFEGCGASFGRSDQLKVHMTEHTGIKPYVCSVEGCGKSFCYSSGLKIHMKVHMSPSNSKSPSNSTTIEELE